MPRMDKKQKKVIIYSTPTCNYCATAKDFFNEHGIKYESYNVATDLERRKEMMEKSGQMGVPVVIIDSEVVVGFNEPLLKELLEID